MPDRSRKRPRDVNQKAASIVEAATGEREVEKTEKDPAAVELGRRGGLKGGPARAAKLSDWQRKEIARKAARTRWATKKGNNDGGQGR